MTALSWFQLSANETTMCGSVLMWYCYAVLYVVQASCSMHCRYPTELVGDYKVFLLLMMVLVLPLGSSQSSSEGSDPSLGQKRLG